ncbi:3-phosphoshikimate 1-carboxyvinyltransferase [Candidatus Gottesmanbacteria bacterium]|nr:3-phosphoshikimate 1-carboxyvinyltransferase [Candidatus Gottesmanbacteria bacterium]
MKVIIKPSNRGDLRGIVSIPPSKSLTHRAIILASLAKGRSEIINPLRSDDTLCTLKACQKLGVATQSHGDTLAIVGTSGRFIPKKSPIHIDCGDSGTTMRFITAVSSLHPSKIFLSGSKRLRERPMEELIEKLHILGVHIANKSHLTISGGGIRGGKLKISGSKSSQYISALLLISPFAQNDVELNVAHLSSSPYVDMTIDLMRLFGVDVEKKGNTYFVKSTSHYKAHKYTVEGDYSSASYFLAVKALTKSDVTVTNLNANSVQGDRVFIEILQKMGKDKLHGIHIDLGNNPDLVPIVSVLSAFAKGTTTIHNIAHLKFKESDRMKSIQENLRRMGIRVSQTENSLTIIGGQPKGSIIDTFHDHRIAMSFAVAALSASGETTIPNAQVVKKSYPNFWDDLKNIGVNIEFL